MAFATRGLSWLSERSAAIVRDFRNTSERLGFKGAVEPDTWADIERDHIRASATLCHLIANFERRLAAKREPAKKKPAKRRRSRR